MKKTLMFGLLFAVSVLSVTAQKQEEGYADRYDTNESGFYVSHATYPFGTMLIVTNLMNQKEVTVQVGGRVPQGTSALVEVSAEAANTLGLEGLTWVKVVEVPKQVKVRAMRSRMGMFKQVGLAAGQSDGKAMTAVHPSLPMGTKIKIRNNNNGKETVVTVTGRIRASQSRIMEVSQAAAQALGIRGTAEVQIETIEN